MVSEHSEAQPTLNEGMEWLAEQAIERNWQSSAHCGAVAQTVRKPVLR